jgi:hypothetical protein
MVKKGRIHPPVLETLNMLIPSLEAIYPDRWDIIFHWGFNNTYITQGMYQPVYFHERNYASIVSDFRTSTTTWEQAEQNMLDYYYNSRDRWQRTRDFFNLIYPTYSSYQSFIYPVGVVVIGFDVIIHYPEVTIKNSRKQSLDMKDFFVKFGIDINGTIRQGLSGTKTTYTLAEYSMGYVHSHLHSASFSTWNEKQPGTPKVYFGSFCLGQGEIIDFMQYFNGNKNQGDLDSYLLMIQTVVSWESLEGGPYQRIENVIPKTNDIPTPSLDDCKDVLNKIAIFGQYYPDIDWKYEDGEYKIVDNEKFENLFRNCYSQSMPEDFIVYKDDTGSYFVPTKLTEESVKINDVDFLIFKGQKVYLKIEGELKFAGERKPYINPKIKQYVKHKLEHVCNKIKVREYTLERLNQNEHNRSLSKQS